MPETISFNTSFKGYNKQEVHDYLEKVSLEVQNKLKAKDDEIADLRNKILNLNNKIDSAGKEKETVLSGRDAISDALIKAQETAQQIIAEAKIVAEAQAEEYKKKVDLEYAKYEMIKGIVISVKDNLAHALKKFDDEITKTTDVNLLKQDD